MKSRRQANLNETSVKILDHFAEKYSVPELGKLDYQQTLKVMAAKLGYKL